MLRAPVLALLAATAFAADPANQPKPVPTEDVDFGTKKVKIFPRREVTLKEREDDKVKQRYLWYRSFDGKTWGQWQKHGISFDRQTKITWPVPEGHWQAHVQIEETSGLISAAPAGDIAAVTEFIIDRTAPAVTVAFPGTKAKLRGGDKYTVRWDATDPYLRAAPVSVRWSRDGATWETVAENVANSGSFEWTTPRDMTEGGHLQVLAMDKAANVGQATATGIVIDSIKPNGRVTGPAISASQTLAIDTVVEDRGPAGLTSAQLYLSLDDGTSWTEGPAILAPFKTVAWKAPADGRYRFAIVGTDGAGNMTATPKGKADDQFTIIVDTTAPQITLNSTIGINEATAVQQVARRAFKPGDRLQVPVQVKDANLKANSLAVFMRLDASKPWVELGRDLPADTAPRFTLGKDVSGLNDVTLADTKAAQIRVTAMDLAGNPGEVIAAETFEIQTAVEVQGPTLE
jgi:hypothetical protein